MPALIAPGGSSAFAEPVGLGRQGFSQAFTGNGTIDNGEGQCVPVGLTCGDGTQLVSGVCQPNLTGCGRGTAGSSGQAAYLRFLDRRVPSAGLELPMLLSPGHYRLALRMRAQSLRSEMGLQWIIACAGAGGEVARIESIDGSFGWREFEADFQIPSSGCPGQWLRLVNPVPAGAAQRVVGELWVDDVRIVAQGRMQPAAAVQTVASPRRLH